ncbi:EamA family transporter [Segniliparus rotundus]|nr:DMT family transporter [Segniliparus rotundus]
MKSRREAQFAGLPLAVGAAVCFGVSGPLAKTLTQAGWSTGGIVLTRLAVAAVAAAVVAQWFEPDWARGVWRHKRGVALYGLISMAVSPFCFFSAAQHMSVGIALMLEYLSPVVVIGWLWVSARVRPSATVLTGAAVALVGALAVLGVFSGASIDGAGVFWGLAAASANAAYFILGHRFSDRVAPTALAAGGLLFGAVVMGVFVALGFAPAVKGSESVTMAGGQTGALVPLLALGFMTGLAYPFGVAAISRLRPTVASILGLLEIPVAVLMAWLLLGECLNVFQGVGAVVLLAGVVLTQRQSSPTPHSPVPQDVPQENLWQASPIGQAEQLVELPTNDSGSSPAGHEPPLLRSSDHEGASEQDFPSAAR